MTMNDTWGFKKNDTRWKSARTLLENLIDIASKGGNYLLNVGPTPEGEIPAASVERLAEMGKWLRRNGTALYGTTASPFPRPLAWGRVTQKPGKLYLHVFDTSKPVELPPLGARVTAISTLAGKKKVAYTQTEAGITIALPDALKAETIPVLVAEVSGAITAPTSPELRQSADGRLELQAADAHVRGATARYEPDKRCIGFWTNPKDSVYWEVTLTRPGTYRVEMELACERVTAGTPFTLAVGKAKLSSHVPATGDWTTFQTFPIGTITITQTGKQIVLVLPQGKPVSGVMNLRRVLLTPA
jgi:alpha-L-fucosidase